MFRLILLVACFGVAIAHPQKRVAGDAFAADIQDFPYQVSIYHHDKYYCNGAIISEDYVLTTIHCVAYPRDGLSVRAGSSQLNVGGSVHKIAKVIEHDHYSSNLARFNDIALLKVEPKFEFDETTKPIALVDAKVSVTEGHTGIISGWGTVKDASLKAVSTNIMSLLDCVEVYHSRFGNFLSGALCAKNERPGGAACSEIWSADDSGAPLVVDGKLAGVFSWGYMCDKPGFPSVFMEVAYYRNWIKRNSGV